MRDLEQVLTALPDSVDWPEPSPHLAARVRASIDTAPPRTRRVGWIWTAVMASALALMVLPGPRQAIADLIVEAGVRIGFIEEMPPVGAGLELGEETTLSEAEDSVDFPVRVPANLGQPEGVYVDDGRVSMVWPGDGSLPAAGDSDVAVLLTQASGGSAYAQKGLDPATTIDFVTVEGEPGVWIEGAEHTITLIDAEGELVQVTTRIAANVLLWMSDGVDQRLELAGGFNEALAIAESLG